MPDNNSNKYKALTLSGGGVRGLISALVLQEIEVRTNKPISSLFDIIVGTSTGGLAALVLNKPDDKGKAKYSASDLVSFYYNNAHIIFQPKTTSSTINFISNLFSPKYNSQHRYDSFRHILGSTLIESSLSEVVVTSYDTELRVPVYITSNIKEEKEGENRHIISSPIYMYEAAMATSAAPTFFQPFKLKTNNLSKGYYSLVDGGIYANNPSYIAIQYGLCKGYSIKDIILCSIGTGSLTRPYTYNSTSKWGLVNWVQPLIDMLMDSQSCSVNVFGQTTLKDNYYKFDCLLTEALDDMDNSTLSQMSSLITQALHLIHDKTEYIDKLCESIIY